MEYRRLNSGANETRFLRILPSLPEGCSERYEIVTASLTKVPLPVYTALSYTWGDNHASEEVEIDGRVVLVTKNLKAALQGLNLQKDVLIWIDALCINQGDRYEKSHQVNMMGEIFARARTVIAWLGEANDDTEHAMELLNRVATIFKSTQFDGRDRTKSERRAFLTAVRARRDPVRALRGLRDLLTRPFWERVWIIQEVANAYNVEVQCGKYSTGIGPFWRVFNHVTDLAQRSQELLSAIYRFRFQQQNIEVTRMGLLEAMWVTRHSCATEPRDRVFALINLTSDGRDIVPLPDYENDLETVFREISDKFIRKQRRLAVLLLNIRTLQAWSSKHGELEASLAVEWTQMHDYVPEWLMRSFLEPSKWPMQCTMRMTEGQLTVSGSLIGSIVDCEGSRARAESEEKNTDPSDEDAIIDIYTLECQIYRICSELERRDLGAVRKFPWPLPRDLMLDIQSKIPDAELNVYLEYPLRAIADLKCGARRLGNVIRSIPRLTPRSYSSETSTIIPWDHVESILDEQAVFGMKFGLVRESHESRSVRSARLRGLDLDIERRSNVVDYPVPSSRRNARHQALPSENSDRSLYHDFEALEIDRNAENDFRPRADLRRYYSESDNDNNDDDVRSIEHRGLRNDSKDMDYRTERSRSRNRPGYRVERIRSVDNRDESIERALERYSSTEGRPSPSDLNYGVGRLQSSDNRVERIEPARPSSPPLPNYVPDRAHRTPVSDTRVRYIERERPPSTVVPVQLTSPGLTYGADSAQSANNSTYPLARRRARSRSRSLSSSPPRRSGLGFRSRYSRDDRSRTSMGIALVCAATQPGDDIVQLPGLQHPVLLRRTTGGSYRLVGECIFSRNPTETLPVELSGNNADQIRIDLLP